eukprot:scaffold714_cov121-Isochrysis_galbana.AAC.21
MSTARWLSCDRSSLCSSFSASQSSLAPFHACAMRSCSALSSCCSEATSASRCAHSFSLWRWISLSALSFSSIAASPLSTVFHRSCSIRSRSTPSPCAEVRTSMASDCSIPPWCSIRW